MKVILQQDVGGLGDAGAVVEVKPGYARNYLIPQGLGLPASEKNLRRLDHLKRQIAATQAKAQVGAEGLAEKLAAFSCTVPAKAGEEDKLFGAVTTQEIAGVLADNGFDIDRRQILLEEPIKMLGVYTVPVRLHREVTVEMKVWVVSEDAVESAGAIPPAEDDAEDAAPSE